MDLEKVSTTIIPLNINMGDLINSIEKEVSQFSYTYKTNLKNKPTIKIKVKNENIPHLMGLNIRHHVNLPTNNATQLFKLLKENSLSIHHLKKIDENWFETSQDKVVGVALLYQILNLLECKVYSTSNIIKKKTGKRFHRDSIYFIFCKESSKKNYTLELSAENKGNVFFPKSLKINDKIYRYCEEVTMSLKSKQRIRKSR